MSNNEQAVIDAACNYIAVVRSVDADTPPALLDIVSRRRAALTKAVDRLRKQCE